MTKLSLKASGLLYYMNSLDGRFTTEKAREEFKDGKHSVRMALDELISAGLVTREQKRNKNGRMGAVEYHLKGDILS